MESLTLYRFDKDLGLNQARGYECQLRRRLPSKQCQALDLSHCSTLPRLVLSQATCANSSLGVVVAFDFTKRLLDFFYGREDDRSLFTDGKILMMEAYQSAWLALGSFGALYLFQFLVLDFVGIANKHVPGMPITGGHKSFLFRASRCYSNTSETVGILILLTAFAIAVGVAANTVATLLWLCVGIRVVYTACYYLDLRTPRSIVFALYMITLIVLLGTGIRAAL